MAGVQGSGVETKVPTFEKLSQLNTTDCPETSAKGETPPVVDRDAAKRAVTYESRKMVMPGVFAAKPKKAPELLSKGKPISGNTDRAMGLAKVLLSGRVPTEIKATYLASLICEGLENS